MHKQTNSIIHCSDTINKESYQSRMNNLFTAIVIKQETSKDKINEQ